MQTESTMLQRGLRGEGGGKYTVTNLRCTIMSIVVPQETQNLHKNNVLEHVRYRGLAEVRRDAVYFGR